MNLVGPPTDVEPEWEYSPTEMKKMREQERIAKESKLKEELNKAHQSSESGISFRL